MNFYNNLENLTSEMHEFGTFRLTYEPPQDALETTIDMSISAKANFDQMTEFFGDFLEAARFFEDGVEDEINRLCLANNIAPCN